MIRITLFVLVAMLFGCSSQNNTNQQNNHTATQAESYETLGSIERLDPELDKIIVPDAKLEILAKGFEWSEGPVWVPQGNYLLFSDIPNNSVIKWKKGDSTSLYLKPAGFTEESSESKEPGSNGLVLDREGRLVLCQHGDRRIARMDAPLSQPESKFVTIVDNYEGKRLNSPNDLVYLSNGDLYFTDPPYGLPGGADSPAKELGFQGVYRFDAEDSTLTLLTQELSRPNGIGFSPDGKTLYVANSDPEKAIWMAYDVKDDGNIENGRIFYDATEQAKTEKGLPDGMTVHTDGYVFATGPGGVWIFKPDGTHLGTIKTGEATANCTFNDDETSLYITADMYLLRLKLKSGKASS